MDMMLKEDKHKRVHTECSIYLKFKTTILTSNDERDQNSDTLGGMLTEEEPTGGCWNAGNILLLYLEVSSYTVLFTYVYTL